MNQGGLKYLARVDQTGSQGAKADPIQVQEAPLGIEREGPEGFTAEPRGLGKEHTSDIARVEQTLPGNRRPRETTAAELECARKSLCRLCPDALATAQVCGGIGSARQALRRRTTTTLEQLLQQHGIAAKPKIDLNLRPHTRKTQNAVKGDSQS
jgi:hypothetical protein